MVRKLDFESVGCCLIQFSNQRLIIRDLKVLKHVHSLIFVNFMAFDCTLSIEGIISVAANVGFFVIVVTEADLLALSFILLNFINDIVSNKRCGVNQILFTELWAKVLLILIWSVYLKFSNTLSQKIIVSWSNPNILVFQIIPNRILIIKRFILCLWIGISVKLNQFLPLLKHLINISMLWNLLYVLIFIAHIKFNFAQFIDLVLVHFAYHKFLLLLISNMTQKLPRVVKALGVVYIFFIF